MTELLDETLSIEIATRLKSKRKNCFDNAYKAALATDGAIYVQGFLAAWSTLQTHRVWLDRTRRADY